MRAMSSYLVLAGAKKDWMSGRISFRCGKSIFLRTRTHSRNTISRPLRLGVGQIGQSCRTGIPSESSVCRIFRGIKDIAKREREEDEFTKTHPAPPDIKERFDRMRQQMLVRRS